MAADSIFAQLLLPAPMKISARQLDDALRSLFPDLQLNCSSGGDPDAINPGLIEVGGCMLALMSMPFPVPADGSFDAALAHRFIWSDADRAVEAHRAHVIVTSFGRVGPSLASKVECARVVTFVCAALAQIGKALGLYWKGSQHLVSPQQLAASAASCAAGERLPTDVWVRPYWAQEAGKNPRNTFATRGLSFFSGFELETDFLPIEPGQLLGGLYAIVQSAVDGSMILKPNETIGLEGFATLRTRYSPNGSLGLGPTLMLELAVGS